MRKRVIKYGFIGVLVLLVLTCTKRNDFLSQYASKIESINPSEGYPTEIIEITGKGFLSTSDLVQYYIRMKGVSELIEATAMEGKLLFEIPATAQTGFLKVYTYYKNVLIDSTSSTQAFVIHNNYTSTPVILRFTPERGSYGTMIEISGKNFSTYKNDIPIVRIDKNHTLETIDYTDTTITARLNVGIKLGKYMVSVRKKDMQREGSFLEGNAKSMFEVLASSALVIEGKDITIGDSIRIKGQTGAGLSNSKNILLKINGNEVLCPFAVHNDSLVGVKITNDVYQYIIPQDNGVFEVSILFENQQTILVGNIHIAVSSKKVSWEKTSVTIDEDIVVTYNEINVQSAILHLKKNGIIVAQGNNGTITAPPAPPPATGTITFDKSMLKNILGASEKSVVVEGEIVVNDANGKTTYSLGYLTINEVTKYTMPTIANALKANDIITITGSRINTDANRYTLTGFGKNLLATSVTNTSIHFTIPTDIPAGTYDNITFNETENGTTLPRGTFSVTIIPTITRISPTSGGDSTILNIVGYNLYPKNKIYFGNNDVNTHHSEKEDIVSPYQSYSDTIYGQNLTGNTSYIVGIGDEASNSTTPSAVSTQAFTYTISGLNVWSTNTNKGIAKASDMLKVSGRSIQSNSSILLKYNGIASRLSATKDKDTLSTELTDATINSLSIPSNKTSDKVLVYIALANGSEILAGSIMITPTATIRGMTPSAGSKITGDEMLSFDGSHLSNATASYILRIGKRAVNASLANSTNVKFKIPRDIAAGDSNLYLVMNGDTLNKKTTPDHIIIIPTITKITPTSGGDGTVVTATGYNFAPHIIGAAATPHLQIKLGLTPEFSPMAVSSDFQVLSFKIPKPNMLAGGMAYPIELVVKPLTTISTATFTYNMSGLGVSSNNAVPTILEAGDRLTITGDGLDNVTEILLKNGVATQRILVSPTTNISISITAQDISGLGISDNQASATVQVYLIVGNAQTLAGSIIVKPQPTFTNINPLSGKGNDVITINGTHLNNATRVLIGTIPVSITSATGTAVKFKIPTHIPTGDSVVSLVLDKGTITNVGNSSLSIVPTITKITPTSGTDGDEITLQGNNFGNTNTININSQTITPTLIDAQNIKFTLPAGLNAGVSYPITLTTGGSTVTSPTNVTYIVKNIIIATTGTNDILANGNTISITGNGLSNNITSIILKNGTFTETISVSYSNNTLTSGAITTATIDNLGIADNLQQKAVQVYLLVGGTQTLVGSILVKPQPTITSASPLSGKGNDVITIVGKHLSTNINDYNITIGTTTIVPTSATATAIKIKIPTNIPAGGYNMEIKLNGATPALYTSNINIAPTITRITPTSGSNGTPINVQGYNFGNSNNDIVIGGNTISNISSPDNQTLSFSLNNTAFANLIGGTAYPIELKTNGQSTTSTATFTYLPNGTITNIAPIKDGDNITINGNGLQNITAIILKYGNNTQSISVISTTNISVTTNAITDATIDMLNIPINKPSDVVQVYLLVGGTQTLIGSIIVKPKAEITGMDISNTDTVTGNSVITLVGKHLSTNTGDYRITIGGIGASITAATGNSIKFKVPTSVPADIDIPIVITAINVSTPTLPTTPLVINIAPTIISITPASVANNGSVSILGNNFPANATIYFGDDDKTSIFTINSILHSAISATYITSNVGTYPLTIRNSSGRLISNPKNITLR